MQTTKPCASREHIESIDKPGHCVWCDAPIGTWLQRRLDRTLPYPSAKAQRVTLALDELALVGSDVATLLAAINAGACLELGKHGDKIVGVIREGDGSTERRYHRSTATTLPEVLCELADSWKRYADQHGNVATASIAEVKP